MSNTVTSVPQYLSTSVPQTSMTSMTSMTSESQRCQRQFQSARVPECTRPARELHRRLGLHRPRCSLIELELMVLMDDREESGKMPQLCTVRVEFDAHSVYLSICLSIYLSIHLSIHLSIYPSIHLSSYPFIHLSIYPSIYLMYVCNAMECNAKEWNGMECM